MQRTLGHTAGRGSYAILNDDVKREIQFNSVFDGKFSCIFGKKGSVLDVKGNDEWDFIELASAYMKKWLYKTRTALDLSAMPIKLNFEEFKTEANESIAKMEEKWKRYNFLLMWS